jgi:hypothetical protein
MDIISQHLAVESYKDLQELYWNSKRSKAFFNNYFLSNFPLYFVYRDSFERRLNENFLEKIGILQKSKDSQWCWDQDGGRILIHGDRSFDLTQESIKELNHWSAYYLTLDYSSRLDGFETGWVRVEQYRSQGVFSEFLSPYSLSVHSNKNNEQTLFWEYEILSSHVGLIIDPELKKVFLNGKALTSKDLPTQKTLVDVLVLLFLNKQSSIRNTDLPLSSYSKNKNDFVGKVITPIHWLLRECGFTGTLLSTRGTNSDFQIMAGMRDFEMGFLQGRS